ncbi:MAG: phosphoethanolamine transferase [Muribaculaceae bacterium]|nr:phosphoethanolamine transferase [Muribaculaceae bacterium]
MEGLSIIAGRVWKTFLKGGKGVIRFMARQSGMTVWYILALSAVTLVAWRFDGTPELSGHNFAQGVRSALIPALVLGVVRGLILICRPRMWRRLLAGGLTAAVTILSLAEIWLSFVLRTRWSDRIIRLIADTGKSESGEFLQLYFLTPRSLGIVVGYLLLLRVMYVLLRNFSCRISARNGGYVAGSICCLLAAAGIVWGLQPPENNYNALNSVNTANRLIWVSQLYGKSLANVKALERTPRLADGHLREGYEAPERIVWVIGESDSRAHWSAYGYGLSTTPCIEAAIARGDVLLFEDVICFEPRTYRMMEILFSPYVVTEPSRTYLTKPLTPMILRKAGYKVRLHDNQATLVKGDDQAEVGTGNFMNSWRLSHANFDYRNERMYPYDADLFGAERDMLHDTVKQTLDIFHINGQHFFAGNRYPERFGRFTAADYPHRSDLSREEKEQVAAYDNATLYVDSLLLALSDELKGQDAILIYHPDHGEEMNDERHCSVRTLDSHKIPQAAPYVLEIPFMVFTTPEFRERHPELYAALRKAASEKQSLIYFSHFLLDLAGVESRYLKREYSPLAPEWCAPPRVVKEIGKYDVWIKKHR